MKPATLILSGLFLVFIACKNPKPDLSGLKDGADTTKADTGTKADEKVVEYDSAAMMKAWEEYMTPGEMHKWMAKWDGTWTVDVTSYMDENAPPDKSTATVTNKMIMNGLYQESEYTGTMWGQPFMGKGILAYDNAKKEFYNTWIDNLGSGVIIMRGKLDPSSNKLTLTGTQTNPMNGQDGTIRQEIVFTDDNTQMFTMWGEGPDGKEHKFMDATMKRKM